MKKKQFFGLVAAAMIFMLVTVTGLFTAAYLRKALGISDASYTAEPDSSIAIVTILGEIGPGTYDVFGNPSSSHIQSRVLAYIHDLTQSEENKGIFLYIDSPGGSVFETDEVYLALMNYKAVTGRPVFAYAHRTMASGAYYIACAADEIYANRNSTVGSIGVYIQALNYAELFDKLGIQSEYVKTGENKAMGNPYEPLTEEQRAIYQSIVDEHYEQFLGIVMDGRGYTRDELLPIADGRVYTASQAVENNLIDGTGIYETLLGEFCRKCGADNIYRRVYNTNSVLTFLGGMSNSQPKSDTERTIEFLESIESGVPMYYYAG